MRQVMKLEKWRKGKLGVSEKGGRKGEKVGDQNRKII